jgi:hypothetical protein
VVYLFGSSVRAAVWNGLGESYEPSDDQTRIRNALNYVLGKGVDREIGSVVLITDGADGSFRAEKVALGENPAVIHSIVVGGDDPLDDQAIVSLHADPTAYVGVPAMIRADVRALGDLRGAELRVQLWHESRLEQDIVAELDQNGRGTVTFEVAPQRTGRSLYRLLIPAASNDEVPQNNDRAALLRVGRERLRALLVAGRPSWDVRFLRDFLKRDGSVDLVSFFILRAAADLTAAPTDELALIPHQRVRAARRLVPDDRRRSLVRRRPLRGHGYRANLAGQAWRARRAQRKLPRGGQQGSCTASHRGSWTGPRADEADLESASGPVRGQYGDWGQRRGSGLAPASAGILVVGEAGRGRVAAMTADASWRWRFAADDTTVGSDEYELFWDRMIRWLTHDPLLEPARISTDRERYGLGGELVISGKLRDENYRPMDKTRVELQFQPAGQDDAVAVVETDEDGLLQATMRAPAEPGAYEIVASVENEDVAREVFIVEQSGDELAELEVLPDELEALAEKTGGRLFLGTADVPPLSELAATTRRTAGLMSKQPLSNPWYISLTVLLLGAVWVLRRRWGRR